MIETFEELEVALAHHVARAGEKIRRMGLKACRIEVFLQTNRFRVGEPQYCPIAGLNLDEPSASTSELLGRARELLKEIYRTGFRYQKTGVSLGGLVREEGIQECLPFVGSRKASLVVDAIVDRINQKLGDRKSPVITRGAMGTKLSPQRWRMKSGLRSPAYTTSWTDLPVAMVGEMKGKRN
jgi:DNA polymerase V